MPTALDLLGTAAPIAGGLVNLAGSRSATKNLVTGANAASGTITSYGQQLMDLYNRILKSQQSKLQPYEDVGAQNLQTYNTKANAPVTPFSYTGEDFYKDPGYAFGLNEGEKGLEAAGNAGGNRFSGGTAKALARYATDYASTKYNEGFNRSLTTYDTNYKANQDQLNRIASLAGMGQQATNTDVAAQGDFAKNAGQTQMVTAQSLANLQQQLAEAQAAGDIGKANALNGMIQGVLNQSQGKSLLNTVFGNGGTAAGALPAGQIAPNLAALGPGAQGPVLADLAGTGAGTAGTAGGAALAGAASGAATAAGTAAPLVGAAAAPGGILATTGALAAPEIAAPALAAGAGEAGAAAGAGGATAAGSGGLLSSVSSLMTNPITIGVGAAILGGYALIKGLQTRGVANDFANKFQDPFVNTKGTGTLNKVVDGFDKALASGQLDRNTAQQMRDQTAQLIQQFMAAGNQFAQSHGDKQKSVWNQATRTMAQAFGGTVDPTGHNNNPDWSRILGKMDQEIAALPQAA